MQTHALLEPGQCGPVDGVCRNIPNRLALAKAIHLHHAAVYRAFDEHWSGGVSLEVLVAMSVTFNMPVGWLVLDPRGQ